MLESLACSTDREVGFDWVAVSLSLGTIVISEEVVSVRAVTLKA